jgi:hypothetical protein
MRSTHFRWATAAVVLVAGSLLATPAYAKNPPRPTVRIPSSFNIPWWDCEEDAWTWVDVKDGKRVRVRDYDVTIRKPGYTEPIGDDICGYMGSGTYNFRVKVYTQERGWKWKKRAVYKTVTWQELDHYEYGDFISRMTPFQCQWFKGKLAYDVPASEPIDPQGDYNWYNAYYNCTIPGDPSWLGFWYDTGNGSTIKYDYTVNRAMATGIWWLQLFEQGKDRQGPGFPYQGQHVVYSDKPGLTTGEPLTGEIRVVTGQEATPIYVTKSKRKFDHWKRYRVKAWKNAGSFVVTGQVQVRVG